MNPTPSIVDKLVSGGIWDVLKMALLINLGTLGANQLLKVMKKMVNSNSKIKLQFDLDKPMSLYNVIVAMCLSVLFVFADMSKWDTWKVISGALAVFLTSFVTWRVGIKETVLLIPAAIKALRNKLEQ